MPRGPRLDHPGALHHVIVRGIERRKIFRSDRDRRGFLDRLAELTIQSGAAIYAWSLMPNHAHVAFRTGSVPLSAVAQRWLGPYATTFNRVHARAGHLFQNRFKNTLVEEEVYPLKLVRYIHLNPVRSRLSVTLDSLDRYRWTGHAVLLGHRQLPAQDTDFVLKHFGRRVGEARRAYRRFVREGMQNALDLHLEGGGLRRSSQGWEYLEKLGRGRERWAFDERILGGGEFVQEVLHACQTPRPTNGAGDPQVIVRALCERAGDRFEVGEAEIASSSLRRAALMARAAVSYAAVRHYGLTLATVARQLGVSGNSIARALRRAEKLDPKLRDLRVD